MPGVQARDPGLKELTEEGKDQHCLVTCRLVPNDRYNNSVVLSKNKKYFVL